MPDPYVCDTVWEAAEAYREPTQAEAWAMRRGQASLTRSCGDGCVSLSGRLSVEEGVAGDAWPLRLW